MTPAEIFDKGYAIPVYAIHNNVYKYKEREFEVPEYIERHDIGLEFKVVKIGDILLGELIRTYKDGT